MHIAICGSLNFTQEMSELAEELKNAGHEVTLPLTSQKILNGEVTLEAIKQEKANGTFSDRAIQFDSIRAYWDIIQNADAILVANYEKNGVKNYIGGNSFLEMGFAHVLRKPIYLLNEIPEMGYTDELRAMQPIVLSGDLSKVV